MTALVFYITGQVSQHDTTTTLGSFCTGFVFVTFISFSSGNYTAATFGNRNLDSDTSALI